MSKTSKPTFKGYTQQDWDEVSDNPELTAADFQKAAQAPKPSRSLRPAGAAAPRLKPRKLQ
jgi:hypothetical protein